MGHTILSLSLLLLLLAAAHSEYSDLLSLELPPDVLQIDFSGNHQFLGAARDYEFTILNGRTGQFEQKIGVDENLKIVSFAFSPNGQQLILGLNDGSASLLEYDPHSRYFENTERNYTGEILSSITSICFSGDGLFAVLGQANDNIIYWDLRTDSFAETSFDGQFVFAVACSQNGNQFAVGGGSGSTSKLTLFQAVPQNGSFGIIHDFATEPTTTVFGIAFSADDKELLSVGKKNYISVYELQSYSESKLILSNDTKAVFKKVHSSDDSQFIAVAQQQSVIVLQEARIAQIFPTQVPIVALSRNGDNLVYMKNNQQGVGVLASLCDLGEYYENSQCTACDGSCSICEKAEGECYLCASGHYLQGDICKDCIIGCLNCVDGVSCQECNAAAHFFSQDGICLCQPGTFLYGDMCVPCIEGCLLCDGLDTCIQCDEAKRFVLHDGLCQCNEGFYDDFGTCKACGWACLSCLNDEFCYSCDEASHYALVNRKCVCNFYEHFVEDGDKCVCEESYFLHDDVCSACLLGCQKCQDADTCQQCKDGLHIEENTCKCNDAAQYIEPIQGHCINCNITLPNCVRCLEESQCLTCEEGLHRHLESGHCLCDRGFYSDDQPMCQKCAVGCLECTSQEECQACNVEGHWRNEEGVCKCEDRFTQVEDVCIACSEGCLQCTPEECQQCDAANHWEDDGHGGCHCKEGFFEQDGLCLKCMHGCLECRSAEICDTCDESQGFIADQGKCVCQSGYFPQKDSCEPCKNYLKFCVACTSETNCSSCSSPFVPVDGKCACQKGFFLDGDHCTKCGDECLACTGAKQCTECASGYVLDKGICKKDGPAAWKYAAAIAVVLLIADLIFQCLK